jgi:hypothetical protein
MIYIGSMEDGDPKVQPPIVADRAICLYDTPGEAPEEKWLIDYPSFQVRVRGQPNDYPTVRAKVQAIFNALHAQEMNIGTAYVFVYAKNSGPLSLGNDERRRVALVQNYRVMVSRVSP